MLTNIDQEGTYVDMGVGRIFSRRGAPGDFSKIFLGEVKSGKICIFPLENKKRPFLLKFSKSPCPPLPTKPPCPHFRRPCTWTQHG